jgi:hypothetical protein
MLMSETNRVDFRAPLVMIDPGPMFYRHRAPRYQAHPTRWIQATLNGRRARLVQLYFASGSTSLDRIRRDAAVHRISSENALMGDKTSALAGILFGAILGYVFWLYNWLNVVGLVTFMDSLTAEYIGLPITRLIPGSLFIVGLGALIGFVAGSIAGISRTDY